MKRTTKTAPAPSAAVMNRVLNRLGRCYEIDRFVKRNGSSPFRILIGCVLSLRTKDEVSYPATDRLFSRAATPRESRLRTVAAGSP